MVSPMFALVGMIFTFIIGWQLSRRFMRWQLQRQMPEIEKKTETIDNQVVYKAVEEAMTYGWKAAKNGFSIHYFHNEDSMWYAGFFKTIFAGGQEHVLYMKEYSVENGLIDISMTVPTEALHQSTAPITPSYLPENNY